MAKILLVNPSYTDIYGSFSASARAGVLIPPYGLAMLAANLDECHEARIIDMELDPDIDGLIGSFRPDYVGITFTTPLYDRALDLCKRLKDAYPGIWIVAGGPHPTACPETVIGEEVDTVIVGEGEIALNAFLKNPAKGIMSRAPLVEHLDSLRFAARDLLANQKYLFGVNGKGIVPQAGFMSSRGCFARCTFCSQHVTFGRKVRYRSVDHCLQEMYEIRDRYNIRHLSMLDDTLGYNRSHTYELFDRMTAEQLAMTFEGYTRCDVITREFLDRATAAGMNRLSLGIESGNQELLNAVRKGTRLESIEQAYALMSEYPGLETRGSIILGLPGETKGTVRKTIKFIKGLNCDQVYVNVLVPFPGTEIYRDARAGKGGLRLLTDDWSQYRRWGNAVIEVNDLTADDLIRLQRKVLLDFYLRPKQIWHNVTRAGPKAFLQNGWAFAQGVFGRGKRGQAAQEPGTGRPIDQVRRQGLKARERPRNEAARRGTQASRSA